MKLIRVLMLTLMIWNISCWSTVPRILENYSYTLNPFDPNTSYEVSDIVGDDNQRHYCRDASKCSGQTNMPGASNGWVALEANESVDRTQDNWNPNSNTYEVDSTIKYFQYEWKCTDAIKCNNAQFNPVGVDGDEAWEKLSALPATGLDNGGDDNADDGTNDEGDNTDNTDNTDDTDNTDNEEEEERTPPTGAEAIIEDLHEEEEEKNLESLFKRECFSYKLLKFKRKFNDYRKYDIVLHNKKRYVCTDEMLCQLTEDIEPGTFLGDLAWGLIRAGEAEDLTQDNYDPSTNYDEGDEMILGQYKLKCARVPIGCSIPQIFPLSEEGLFHWDIVEVLESTIECDEEGNVFKVSMDEEGEPVKNKLEIEASVEAIRERRKEEEEEAANGDTDESSEENENQSEEVELEDLEDNTQYKDGFDILEDGWIRYHDERVDALSWEAQVIPVNLEQDNVVEEFWNSELISGNINPTKWEELFPIRHPDLTHDAFLKAATHFPHFCTCWNDAYSLDDKDSCKLSLMALLAHMIEDTNKNDLSILETTPREKQGLSVVEDAKCKEDPTVDECTRYSDKSSRIYKPVEGKSYHARGTCMLKGSSNYGLLSSYLFNDKNVLLNDPELLVENPIVSFACSIYKFMIPKQFQPSANEMVCGKWSPEGSDRDKGFKPGFGMTTLVLYGSSQCGNKSETAAASQRADNFEYLANEIDFNTDPTWMRGCARLGKFDEKGESASKIFYKRDENQREAACRLTKYKQEFSVIHENAYEKCVKAIGKIVVDDGTNGTTDPNDSGNSGSGENTDPTNPGEEGEEEEEEFISPEEEARNKFAEEQNAKIEIHDNVDFTVTEENLKMRVEAQEYLNVIQDETLAVDLENMDDEPVNVRRFNVAMSEERFNDVFQNRDPRFTYKSIINAVKSFPKFCDDVCPSVLEGLTEENRESHLLEVCKVEVATLFALWIYETGDQEYGEDSLKSGLQHLTVECDEDQSRHYGEFLHPEHDKSYCGKGILKLKSNVEYGLFSKLVFGTKHQLLKVPEKLDTDSDLMVVQSFFRYMIPYSPQPSIHEVTVHLLKPSPEDLENGNRNGFGAAMNILFGYDICGWNRENRSMKNLMYYYESLLKKMGRNFYKNEVKECSKAHPYHFFSSTNAFFFFAPDWESVDKYWEAIHFNENLANADPDQPSITVMPVEVPKPKCKLVPGPTEFPVLLPNSYMNCVKYAKGEEYDPVPEDLKDSEEDNDDDTTGTNPVNDDERFKFEEEEDGIKFNDDEVQKIYKSGQIITESVEIDLSQPEKNPENVQRILRVIPETVIRQLTQMANSILSFEAFLKAAARFPQFCNESFDEEVDLDEMCKREFIHVFTHGGFESKYTGEISGFESEDLIYFNTESEHCRTADRMQWVDTWSYKYKENNEANYCPRGAGNLRGNHQYGEFSQRFLGDKSVLLDEPELVAKDPVYFFASGLYVYMKRMKPQPSVHEVVTKSWTPSEDDATSGNANNFMTTTNVWSRVVGSHECGWYSDSAKLRGKIYKKTYRAVMGTDPTGTGSDEDFACPDNFDFPWDGKANVPESFAPDWQNEGECRLVDWETEWSIFDSNGLEDCRESLNATDTDYYDEDKSEESEENNSEDAIGNFDNEIDWDTANFEMPECQKPEIFNYKAGNKLYKPGTVVKYYENRFMCRHSKLCLSEEHAPETLKGEAVWRILTSEESWDLSMDNYNEKTLYKVNDVVVAGQWEWVCYNDTCGNPDHNPLGEKGREAWERIGIKTSDATCDTESTDGSTEGDTTGTDEFAGFSGGVYSPFVDWNEEGEYAIPQCMDYILHKFNHKKEYEVGEIVYFDGRRRACVDKLGCADTDKLYNEKVWRSLKSNEALNLKEDSYVPGKEYKEQEEVVFLGGFYFCLVPNWCKQLKFNPLADVDGEVWERDASKNVERVGCEVFDGDAENWVDGYSNKEICRDYTLENFKKGNGQYRPGYLVVHDDQIYRCIQEELCTYEEITPGGESNYNAAGEEVWMFVDSFSLTDLTIDNYKEGAKYDKDSIVVYHQHKFRCISENGECGLREYDPYSWVGYMAWEMEGMVESKLTCTATGQVMREDKPVRVVSLTGAPKIESSSGSGGESGTNDEDIFKDRIDQSFEVDAAGAVQWKDERVKSQLDQIELRELEVEEWENLTNVEIAKESVSQAQFDTLFPNRMPGLSYSNFLKALSRFPKICEFQTEDPTNPSTNETAVEGDGGIGRCKREILTLFAYFIMTGDGVQNMEDPENQEELEKALTNGLTSVIDQFCFENSGECGDNIEWDSDYFTVEVNEEDPLPQFYGRGIEKIWGSTNYGFYSLVLKGDKDILLNNPNLLADDPVLAFEIVMLNYSVSFREGPSMKSIITKTWRPNNADLLGGNRPNIGSIMNSISPDSCGEYKPESNYLLKTVKLLVETLEAPLDATEMVGCENNKPFSFNGSGFVMKFWEGFVDHEGNPECHLVQYKTEWFVPIQGSYQSCMQEMQRRIDDGEISEKTEIDSNKDWYDINEDDFVAYDDDGNLEIVNPQMQYNLSLMETQAVRNKRLEQDQDEDQSGEQPEDQSGVQPEDQSGVQPEDQSNEQTSVNGGPARTASQVEPTEEPAYVVEDREKKERIMRVMDKEVFNKLAPKRKSWCEYESVVDAMMTYTKFCNDFHFDREKVPEDSHNKIKDEICAKEIATLFAHISGDLRKARIYDNPNTTAASSAITNWEIALSEHAVKPCENCWSEEYWGDHNVFLEHPTLLYPRGAGMLSSIDEYSFTSELLRGNKYYFLLQPDDVLRNCKTSMETALTKYMVPVHKGYGIPSAHAITVEQWRPNSLDEERGINPGFGATINAVAPEECGEWSHSDNSELRIAAFKLNIEILNLTHIRHGQMDCGKMDHFPEGGSAFVPMYWDAHDYVSDKWTCSLVFHPTEFHVGLEDSKNRCEHWFNGKLLDQVPADIKLPEGAYLNGNNGDNEHENPWENEEIIELPFYVQDYDETTWGEYEIPHCLSYWLHKYKDEKDYKIGDLVYSEGRRFMCVRESCSNTSVGKVYPGENSMVWRDLKVFESVHLGDERFNLESASTTGIAAGDDVNVNGYIFTCKDSSKCNDFINAVNHPLYILQNLEIFDDGNSKPIDETLNLEVAWQLKELAEESADSHPKCKRYPHDLMHIPKKWNRSPGPHFVQEIDFNMGVPCVDYLIHKFDIEKDDHEELDVVFYKGHRFVCMVPEKCNVVGQNHPDMNIGDGWELLPYHALKTLTVHKTWTRGDESLTGQVLDYLGGVYECKDGTACSDENPLLSLVDKDRENLAWLHVGDYEAVYFCKAINHVTINAPEDWLRSGENHYISRVDYSAPDGYGMPTCTELRYHVYDPSSTLYRPGDIVYHKGTRFVCVHHELCAVPDEYPIDLYNQQVEEDKHIIWLMISDEIALSHYSNTYLPGKTYTTGEKVLFLGHVAECLNADLCNSDSPLYHPASRDIAEAWEFVDDDEEEGRSVRDLIGYDVQPKYCLDTHYDTAEVPEDWNKSNSENYEVGVDFSVKGEQAIPKCLDYDLPKFNAGDAYEISDIVYYRGRRFLCRDPVACSNADTEIEFNESVWTPLPVFFAVSRSLNNTMNDPNSRYEPGKTYEMFDELKFDGNVWICNRPELCSAVVEDDSAHPYYFYNDYAWLVEGTYLNNPAFCVAEGVKPEDNFVNERPEDFPDKEDFPNENDEDKPDEFDDETKPEGFDEDKPDEFDDETKPEGFDEDKPDEFDEDKPEGFDDETNPNDPSGTQDPNDPSGTQDPNNGGSPPL